MLSILFFVCCVISAVSSLEKRAEFYSGMISQECLKCICMQESGCTNKPCAIDVGTLSCGYFQIKDPYYTDCYTPGSDWKSCAADKTCASRCVQQYIHRYAPHYHCPNTCEAYARTHNGGTNGCHRSSTLAYWQAVKSHAGCSHLV